VGSIIKEEKRLLKMKKIIKFLKSYFSGKRKTWRIIEWSVTGVFLLYVSILIYPNPFFKYTFKYNNVRVYSTQPIESNMDTIVSAALYNLSNSELNDISIKYRIYLCNNYKLYSFFAPFTRVTRGAFAVTSPFRSIFVANVDIANNIAYKSSSLRTRYLSELLAHEMTHVLINKHLGVIRMRLSPQWKIEGYCEYIGHNDSEVLSKNLSYVMARKQDTGIEAWYDKAYYAVSFLKRHDHLSFDQIIKEKRTLETILDSIK
jgi:hypothetical protein